MRWIGVPERAHIESHGRHELCQVLRPGTTLTQKHPLVDTARHTVGSNGHAVPADATRPQRRRSPSRRSCRTNVT
jgi:hypothetical protein